MDSRELARRAVELARRAGAQEAAAGAMRSRRVELDWRDGKIEKVTEATQRSLSLGLYVDGRYGSVSSSDLRPAALADFIAGAVTMTRALAVDPDRRLPDPELYRGRSTVPLEIDDPSQESLTPDDRRQFAAALEAAARAVPDASAIVSVSTSFTDGWSERDLVTSNGFEGAERSTSFSAGASVSIRDGDLRPEQTAFRTARFRGDLIAAGALGREAAGRALGRRGSSKGKSAVATIVVENRAAGRLITMLLGALSGVALHEKKSFLEGKLGQPLGNPLLSIVDQPHLRRGLASRHFDSEGLATRPRPIVEDGVLRTYFIDSYYARKLGAPPTTQAASNLEWKLGDRSLAQIVAAAGDGFLVTGFLGGNANSATGDFSLGVQGHRITGGKLAEPFGEMNLAGNQTDLWKRLVAVGNDPYTSSSARTPTLAFDGVQIAGT